MRSHLIELPGTDWSLWRWGLLRATGFPVSGLDRLAVPDCAAAADAFLDGTEDAAAYASAFEAAAAIGSREIYELARDPLFREAVAWQNANAMYALDGVLHGGPDGPRNAKRRHREERITRYWQRYCAKNDTIGFFGPVNWFGIDPTAPAVTTHPGDSEEAAKSDETRLIRDRAVHFEQWAVRAYADTLAEDPRVRPWLPVSLPPHAHRVGREIHIPSRAPIQLSATEAAVLDHCDGVAAAAEVAATVFAEHDLLHAESDVYLILEALCEKGALRWMLDLPLSPFAEHVLRDWLDAIPDEKAREVAGHGFARLCAARDEVAAAAGSAEAVGAALARLEACFVDIVGQPARRRGGENYAGRTLCYEDTTRGLDVTLGGAFLAELAGPLDLLLRAARWLSAELADAYGAALRELYDELAHESGSAEVPLTELWYLAFGLFYGAATDRPVDRVAAEMVRRWASLFDLDALPPGTHRLDLSVERIADRAAELFATAGTSWSHARLHSPDLHICASSPEAIRRGDYTIVLGEMHTAWATFDNAIFMLVHPEPDAAQRAVVSDLGSDRAHLLYPLDWPRSAGRVARLFEDDSDLHLAFTEAPRPGRGRVLPTAAVTVVDDGGELVAAEPDGTRRPLVEMFADMLATHAVDGFKVLAASDHSPRITIDRLVVARETWRTTIGATGLVDVKDQAERYLAARRLRRELGLPERVFVKIQGELKPFYVDFSSPLYVASFVTMLRAAHVDGPDVALIFSEMLPGPDDAWVPDAAGNRYLSEVRLQLLDSLGGQNE